MRVLKSLLFSGLILLQSCEFIENTEITDNNQSKTQELNTKKEVPTPPPVAINKAEKDLVTPTIKEEEKKEPEIVDKIEPAKPAEGAAGSYLDYGAGGANFYLEKTAEWINKFRESKRRSRLRSGQAIRDDL